MFLVLFCILLNCIYFSNINTWFYYISMYTRKPVNYNSMVCRLSSVFRNSYEICICNFLCWSQFFIHLRRFHCFRLISVIVVLLLLLLFLVFVFFFVYDLFVYIPQFSIQIGNSHFHFVAMQSSTIQWLKNWSTHKNTLHNHNHLMCVCYFIPFLFRKSKNLIENCRRKRKLLNWNMKLTSQTD